MNKKTKNILITLFLFFVTCSLIIFAIIVNRDSKIDIILDSHSQTLETYYNILQYNQQITADVAYEETISLNKFIDILTIANRVKNNNDIETLNKLRLQAQNLLKQKYKFLRKKGILQYHFVFPDNKVFLRMHKPSKFGDDITSVRSDFNYTNSTLNVIRGFAQGRTAHAFRNIYPIFTKDNQHIGAMEVSFSSELLQNYFTQVNKLHTHFLVRKDIFNSNTWNRDDLILKYVPSSEHPDFMMTMTQSHTKKICIDENSKRIEVLIPKINKKIKEAKKFALYTIYESQARVASFFPIYHNITKEPVAWIVSYNKDPIIDKTIAEFNYIIGFVLVVLILLFIFIYYILNQRVILDEIIQEKTHNLQEMNRDLEESEHELQVLNENLANRVQDEVEKNRKKDQVLFEHTKMAALGEMIGNIAHQWRQPLSVISTAATGMQLQQEVGALDGTNVIKTCNSINENAQYLSRTIDDFTRFIKGNSKKEIFNLNKSIQSFLTLVNSSVKKYQIQIKIDIAKDIELNGLQNELNQCFINLFNNSKDALLFVEPTKLILISAYREKDALVIIFKDNGGGIDEKYIGKVFEPYFTTKHQSQGTGLGLNMTYRLIVEGMHGTINVINETYEYEGDKYTGAKFIIRLPQIT